MEGLTPRYKRGDWPTVNTQTGRQSWTETEDERQTPRLAARSGFDTYLMVTAFPHRLLGIRRQLHRRRSSDTGAHAPPETASAPRSRAAP